MSEISKRYNQLKPNNIARKLNVRINSYAPKLTEDDYSRGYVTRYFAQRVNDRGAVIYEVSNRDFAELESNPLLNTTSLRWRLTGPERPTFHPKTGVMLDMGIRESNSKSIELASENMPTLKLHLPNTIQYARRDS
jgi:hypothetical protein